MKFNEAHKVAAVVFVTAVSIGLMGIRPAESQPNEVVESASNLFACSHSEASRIPAWPDVLTASQIGTFHWETPPEDGTIQPPGTIALVQYVDGGGFGQCSQSSGQCVCGEPCPGCGAAGCDGKQCGRKRSRQSQLSPVAMPPSEQAPGPVKAILGVNEFVTNRLGREPTFQDSQLVPWEMFSYGEYIGPHRTPHVPEYRLRVSDSLEFVFYLTRKQSVNPYQIFVGDVIRISSVTDDNINQAEITVLSDGTISLPLIGEVRAAGKTVSDLQAELNDLYLEYLTNPSVLVQIVEGDTPLKDVIAAVDATQGVGGQVRRAIVSPDGTVQLPVVGSIPAVGLTLDEIRREANARYRERVAGLEVTPVLLERAPRFFYVLGQVTTPGRFEMVGPTTVLQAVALAQGDLQGGNLRNIIIFRRDENWRLTATRLDLAGAIQGRRPFPSDEMFLRDSDIILIPRKPIQRLSEAVDLYLSQTIYSIFPQQVVFDFDNLNSVNP